MLLRLAGGICILFCGGAAGLLISKRISARADFFEQYISFLNQADSMICYQGADIYSILQAVHGVPQMRALIDEVISLLERNLSFSDAWMTAAENSLNRKEFEKEDLPLILSFGEGFGELGAVEESSAIKLIITSASERLKHMKSDVQIRKKLYRTLGLFCGALIAVLLI